jgi:hypothetical protein
MRRFDSVCAWRAGWLTSSAKIAGAAVIAKVLDGDVVV